MIQRSSSRFWIPVMAGLLLATLTLTFGGCSPWATYPPVEHTQGLARPAYEPIPTLMAKSIAFAHDRYNAVDDVVINLPEGVPAKVYEKVIRKIGRGRPMTDDDANAYTIQEIRTRGPEAQVDLVYPRSDGLHELVTLYFKNNLIDGWRIDSTRLWRIRVERPRAHYPLLLTPDGPASTAVASEPDASSS